MAINFNESYQKVNFDIYNGAIKGNFWGKSGDTGRGFEVSLWNDGVYVEPTTEILRINCEKPDGKLIWIDAELVDGVYLIPLTDQVFAVEGNVRAEFELKSNGEIKRSDTFMISAMRSLKYGDVSESDFGYMEFIVQTIEDFYDDMDVIRADELERKAFESERATAEANRMIAERAREQSELARESSETTRETSELARETSESERISKELERSSNEVNRELSETDRKAVEALRVTKESERISSEDSRRTKESERATNETVRISNETTRINAEGDLTKGRVKAEADRVKAENIRIASEDSRVASETDRKASETTRKSDESARKTSESGRVVAETSRNESEDTRRANEVTRKSNEVTRNNDEVKRRQAESGRVSVENTRVTSETQRETNESVRQTNETERLNAESIRKTDESARAATYAQVKIDEDARKANESSRMSAETTRSSNEDLRASNETIRESNEAVRQTQEQQRQLATGQAVTQIEEAVITTKIVWKSAVQTFADIITTYPNPELGWRVDVRDTRLVYRYDGIEWINIGETTLGFEPEDVANKGKAGGYVPLDSNAKIDPIYLGEVLSPADVAKIGNLPVDTNVEIGEIKSDLLTKATKTEVDNELLLKADKTYVDNQTTTINGKTGAIVKEDIFALGVLEGIETTVNTLDTTVSQHLADYVTFKNNIEEVKYEDDKLFLKVNGEWIEFKSGGLSVRLGNVLDLTIEAQVGNKIKINWNDPLDVVLEGITLATWGGTQLRRKLSTYPMDEKDGELVVDNNVRGQYINGYLDEGLVNGQKYYYALFPYTTDNVFTIDIANRIDITAFEKYEQARPTKPIVSSLGSLKATVSSDVDSVVSLDQINWFASPHEFIGLVDGQTYIPYAKFEEKVDYFESSIISGDSFIAINKSPQDPPPAPDISNLDFDRVTVTGISGTEVKLASGEWLNSPQTFTGLLPETQYEVFARMKETETKFASDSSVAKIFSTPPEQKIYGVEIDESNSNPETSVVYIDDAVGFTPAKGSNGAFTWGSWENIIKSDFMIRPCLLNNPAGTVNYYLNYDNFTQKALGGASNLTGADGDVMIEFGQELWWKFSRIGSKLKIQLSTKQFAGAVNHAFDIENGYNQLSFYPLTMLQILFLVMFKNRDTQTALGRGLVDNGSTYLNTGGTNAKTFCYGANVGTQQVKFLGLEDYWGNRYQWIDGCYYDGNHNMLIGKSAFNDTGSGYANNGQATTSNLGGYIDKVQGTNEAGFIPKSTGGSETTHFADYGDLFGGRLPSFGGHSSVGSRAGGFSLSSGTVSSASAAFGGRLCLKFNGKLYIGAYLATNVSNKMRSTSGATSDSNKTIGAFRTLAKANN